MRIGVISRDIELATTDRLLDAGRRRGHAMVPLRLLDGSVIVGDGGPTFLLRGEPTPVFDACIPRLGAYLPTLALAITRTLVATGAVSTNDPDAMALAFDKLRTAERLAGAGVPTPRSILAKDLDHLEFAIDAVGGPPVVIKPVHGAQGRGVMLAESRAAAVAILENLIVTGRDHLVQAYVADSVGVDQRLVVLDGRVIAAMRRRARPGEFRANVHRGGSAEAYEPSSEECARAISAAHAIGLDFAGVDMLTTSEGATVIEVNGSPGIVGIERATEVDLAEAVIVSLERRVGEGATDGPR